MSSEHMAPEQFKQWRQAHGWTQTQVAQLLGTTQASVARWESGARDASGTLRYPISLSMALLVHLLDQPANIAAVVQHRTRQTGSSPTGEPMEDTV